HRDRGGGVLHRHRRNDRPGPERNPLPGAERPAPARIPLQWPCLDSAARRTAHARERLAAMNGQRQARWIVSGIAEAPVEAVADVLCAIQAGPASDHNGSALSPGGLATDGAIVTG